MPTSTLAQECSSQEVNFQSGKKSSIQEKNFKKLQVSVKPSSEEASYISPAVTSANVLLKHGEKDQNFCRFEYNQKHCSGHYSQQNGHMNEYAATYIPSENSNKMDSYVDLSQCEKENKRNSQYRQQVTNAGHSNVQAVSGHKQYVNPKQIHTQNHCTIPIDNCVPQNHNHLCSNVCSKSQRSSKRRCTLLSCFAVTILLLQLVWMGLFAWILFDKIDILQLGGDKGHIVSPKGHAGQDHDDSNEITRAPVQYKDPPHYPTYAPPMTNKPRPELPTLGIKMEIDPSFLTSQGNTVMWTYPDERHLTGIEYHNGYFRVNVTGFYFVQSTLSLDHRPNNNEGGGNIRLNHCIKVDGRPKMDVCENKQLSPIKAGGSTVQDPMMYLESGNSVHVSISHMTKIYDSVAENRFVMFLQRTV
ncbi:uncharacterized protein LOC132551015 [Ylistrum balloti]|uniref:uncharacterized protein LOC132551015 n=1 Tax=Ylistrum balloti TaxID=509963 RepID=UPI0029057F55|nr:uncharacterized protein LOC132551015 [Ylistrum balloti]